MGRFFSLLKTLGSCLREDARALRTRIFVGLANLFPGSTTVSTFVRPVLLQLAGARVQHPCCIHAPMYINDASGLSIGRHAFINLGVRIEGRAPVEIGAGALIGPFVCIENYNHRPSGTEVLPVSIGDRVWLGARVILLPGASIGEDTVIGAGAVVAGKIPSKEYYAGPPARRSLSVG